MREGRTGRSSPAPVPPPVSAGAGKRTSSAGGDRPPSGGKFAGKSATKSATKPADRASGRSLSTTAGQSAVLRCAIYTRKSSEEGLEQDFNSLQAQREACEAYIASQRHEGWQTMREAYDDGGYSGGSMERPGLKALLADIVAGRIDIVVVYKVDRLTRSLADFARIVDCFDAKGVSFVSVTQSFNTTSSMGRLTLNVLLSFAQFEREVTAERIRDKIAASKKKGIFMGGPVPLGYRVKNRKLVIDQDEAQTVRLIFATYLRTKSTIATANELRRMGIRTRLRSRSDGTTIGGVPFTYGPLQTLLRNRVYIGELSHKGQHYLGEHEPLMDGVTFEAVQALLTRQRASPQRTSHTLTSLLTGKIFDANGNRMAPSHTNKKGVRYRYYVSRALLDGEPERAGKPSRIAANEIETILTNVLRQEWAGQNDDAAGTEWDENNPAAAKVDIKPDGRAGAAPDPCAQPAEASLDSAGLVEALLDRVEVFENRIVILVHRHMILEHGHMPQSNEALLRSGDGTDGACSRESEPGPSLKRITVRCRLGYVPPLKAIRPSAATTAGQTMPNTQRRNRERLVIALYKARRWFDELAKGRTGSIEEIAIREGKSTRNVSMMLNLAFLAPDVIEAILIEHAPPTLSASHLAQTLPLDWEGQRKLVAAQR